MGCEEEPVSYSSPVGIELKAESGKAENGILTEKKDITSEMSNPFGAFVNEAQALLGRNPARIEVTEVSLLLGATSTGVNALGAIFAGRVEVFFDMRDSGDTVPVAHAMIDQSVADGGPMILDLDFDSSIIAGGNLQDLINGKFDVVLRGPVHEDFDSLDAKGDIQVTMRFEAFE